MCRWRCSHWLPKRAKFLLAKQTRTNLYSLPSCVVSFLWQRFFYGKSSIVRNTRGAEGISRLVSKQVFQLSVVKRAQVGIMQGHMATGAINLWFALPRPKAEGCPLFGGFEQMAPVDLFGSRRCVRNQMCFTGCSAVVGAGGKVEGVISRRKGTQCFLADLQELTNVAWFPS